MAGQVFVNDAEVLLLAQIRAPAGLDLFGDGVRLDLYVNNLAPLPTSVRTDFDMPTLADYVAVLFDSTDLAVVVSSAGKALTTFNDLTLGTFTTINVAGEVIYGYTICSVVTNDLICAELFAVPRVLALGTPLVLIWNMTLFSEN